MTDYKTTDASRFLTSQTTLLSAPCSSCRTDICKFRYSRRTLPLRAGSLELLSSVDYCWAGTRISAALAPEHKAFPPNPPLTPSLLKLPGGSAHDHVSAKAIFSIQPSPIGIQFAGSTRSREAAGFRTAEDPGAGVACSSQMWRGGSSFVINALFSLFSLFHYRTIVHDENRPLVDG
jgi:hypothetical protein